ncbi:MAG: hypothetical protein GC168_09070 [Candidatus Hydrogenedens sp.]|nr:hypothetical protein [Candidatus Hydrogenedens sp.]
MMNTRVLFAALAALPLLLQACASTPAEYYTLDMRSSGAAAATVTVGHVGLADTLAGGRMPVRTSPTQLDYYAAAQWAGNLSEMISEKLRAEFGPIDPSAESVVVDVRLLSFEQQDLSETSAQAYAKAEASFRTEAISRYDKPLLFRTYEVTEPMETFDAVGLAAALSRCAESIAQRIAADAAAVQP